MHWLDTVLLVVLGIGALLGAWAGLVRQVLRIVAIVVAIYACVYFHEAANGFLTGQLDGAPPFLVSLLAYALLCAVVFLVFWVIRQGLEKGMKAAKLKAVDRVLGALLGVVKFGLAAGAVLMGLAVLGLPLTDSALADSKVAPVLLDGMKAVIVLVPQDYKNEVDSSLQRVKKKAGEAGAAAARSALEGQLSRNEDE
jgi:membrane protein required for colicin V production